METNFHDLPKQRKYQKQRLTIQIIYIVINLIIKLPRKDNFHDIPTQRKLQKQTLNAFSILKILARAQ